MHRFSRILISRLTVAGFSLVMAAVLAQVSLAQTSVRRVKVLGSKDVVEIEVEASARVVPQTQVLTGPDRLVVDIPNAVPGAELRSQSVDRGDVKDLRVGLFQSKPPVTRIVLDLKSARSYQVFPGQTVIIKVMGGAPAIDAAEGVDDFPPEQPTRPGLVIANYTTGAERVRVENQVKPLDVSFRNGLLAIRANKATLSEVLFAVQQRTGAEVSIAAGAEQEKVVVDLGPAPAPEVVAQLLNGSKFNFLILSAANDPGQLDRVILSSRNEGTVMSRAPVVNTVSDDDDPPAPPPPAVQTGSAQPDGPPPPVRTPADENPQNR